jgi:FMN phosphatase YigB (HAD superfamily)
LSSPPSVPVPTTDIDIVLFDLGGVLFDPGGVGPMRTLSGIDSDDELWSRWLGCRWVRSYERGHCTADAFAAGVVEDWALDITPEDFLAAFRNWPRGPFDGAEALVADVRTVMPTGCLSNTNALHWDAHFTRWPVLHELDYRFLSFELGMVKPDPEIFGAVAARLPALPARVLFLDDNLVNVDSAADAGFIARHTRGVAEARDALIALGVLTQ